MHISYDCTGYQYCFQSYYALLLVVYIFFFRVISCRLALTMTANFGQLLAVAVAYAASLNVGSLGLLYPFCRSERGGGGGGIVVHFRRRVVPWLLVPYPPRVSQVPEVPLFGSMLRFYFSALLSRRLWMEIWRSSSTSSLAGLTTLPSKLSSSPLVTGVSSSVPLPIWSSLLRVSSAPSKYIGSLLCPVSFLSFFL